MLKIINILSSAAVVCGLFFCLNGSAAAQQYNAEQRIQMTNAAFNKVYGHDSYASEQAFWLSVWHGNIDATDDIISAETKKLNADPIVRWQMIVSAYKESFGRPPLSEELKKWKARTEIYVDVMKTNKEALYSTKDGYKELTAVIKRYYKDTEGKEATDDEIKKAMGKLIDSKWNYAEMMRLYKTQ